MAPHALTSPRPPPPSPCTRVRRKMGQVNDVNRLRKILLKRPEVRSGADLTRLAGAYTRSLLSST